MVIISYVVILTRIHILFDIDVEKIWVPSNFHIEQVKYQRKKNKT